MVCRSMSMFLARVELFFYLQKKKKKRVFANPPKTRMLKFFCLLFLKEK